jgi:probable rRNA maturation factor
VVAWERAPRTRIEVTLLDAAAMRSLNRKVSGRRVLTDVLSFTLPQPDGSLMGDVYICPAAAERWIRKTGNGKRLRQGELNQELLRLAVHGALHVLGYDHPEGPSRTRSAMWRKQEAYVRRLTGAKR